jgi:hypothetical protein
MDFLAKQQEAREKKRKKSTQRVIIGIIIFILLIVTFLIILPGLDLYESPIGYPKSSWLNTQTNVGTLKSKVIKAQKIQMGAFDFTIRSDGKGLLVKNRNTPDGRFGFNVMLKDGSSNPYFKWEDNNHTIASYEVHGESWTSETVTNGTTSTSSRKFSTITCDSFECDQLIVGEDVIIQDGSDQSSLSFGHTNGKTYQFAFTSNCVIPSGSTASSKVFPTPTLEYETIRVVNSFTVGNFRFLEDPFYANTGTRLRIEQISGSIDGRYVRIYLDNINLFGLENIILWVKSPDTAVNIIATTTRSLIGQLCFSP